VHIVLILVTLFLTTAPVFADHSININTADQATLTTLTGIGDVKAQAIVDYRTEHGPFSSVEDIQNVSGIGPATFNNIKDHITVSGGSSSPPSPTPTPSPSPTPPSPAPAPSPSSAVSSYVAPPEPELYADAGNDRVVVVGADTEFRARAYNEEREIVERARFSWNFGDGSTAEGPLVLHHFAYPGRYVVVLTIAEERNTASDRIVVTAEPANLSFSVLSDGGVAVENRGGNDIDLSRWLVYSSDRQFFIPENTTVLAGQTVRISQQTLGFFANTGTELRYPNGTFALHAGEGMSAESSMQVPVPSTVTPVASAGAVASSQDEAEAADTSYEPREEMRKEDTSELSDVVPASSQVAAAGTTGSWGWWMGAFAIAGIGAGSVYFARRFAKREWDIIEDTSE
jgi:competence protein ComEA